MKRTLLTLVFLVFFVMKLNSQQEGFETEIITVENVVQIEELFTVGSGRIDQIMLSPDGDQLAVVTRLGIYIHDLTEPTSPPRLIATEYAPIINAIFHPQWSWIAISAPETLSLIDVETGQIIREFNDYYDGSPIHATANEMVLSTEGDWLIITRGLDGGFTDVWDTTSGELLFNEYHRYTVGSPVFAPQDEAFAYVYYELGFPGTNAWFIVDTSDWDSTRSLDHATTFGAFATEYSGLSIDESPFSTNNIRVTNILNGTLLLTTDTAGVHRIWNAETGKLLQQLSDLIEPVAIHPDGRLLVRDLQQSSLSFFDPLNGETAPLSLADEYTHYAFDHDGSTLGLVDLMGDIHTYDLTSDKIEYTLSNDYFGMVNEVVFSADNQSVFFTENAVNTRHLEVTSGEISLIAHVPNGNGIMAYAPQSSMVALGTKEGSIELWDAQSNEQLAVLKGHRGPIIDLAFSPDGAHLASAAEDKTLRIWHVDTGEMENTVRFDDSTMDHLTFNHDGTQLLAIDKDNRLGAVLYDIQTMDVIQSYPRVSGDYVAADYSRNGEFVILGGYEAYMWDTDDALNMEKATSVQAAGLPFDIEINPANDIFISTSSLVWYKRLNNTVIITDVNTGDEIMQLPNFPDAIGSLAFSPDGRLLVLGGWDGTVQLWGISANG